jgi:hypothetical protein
MATARTLRHRQTSFAAGEFSPSLYGRTDFQKYTSGARTIENFFVSPQGTLMSRAGTAVVDLVGDASTSNARLVPFIYSDTDVVLMLFQNEKVSFYVYRESLGHVEIMRYGAGSVLYLTTPFEDSHLSDLKFSQIGDVVTVCHKELPPWQLKRIPSTISGSIFSDSTAINYYFEVSNISFDVPYFNYNNLIKYHHNPMLVYKAGLFDHTEEESGYLPWKYQVTKVVKDAYGRLYETMPYTVNGVMHTTPWYYRSNRVSPDSTDDNDVYSYMQYEVVWQHGRTGYFYQANENVSWVIEDNASIPEGGGGSWDEKNATYFDPVIPYTSLSGVEYPAFFKITPDEPVYIDWSSYYPQADPTDGVEIVETRIYRGIDGRFGYVGSVQHHAYDLSEKNARFLDDGAIPDYSTQPPQGINPFTTEYPLVSAIYEGRRVFSSESKVYMSAVEEYNNFDEQIPPQDSSALSFELATNKYEEIRSIIPRQGLYILTDSSEWLVTGAGDGTVITPSSIAARLMSSYGSGKLDALDFGESIIFMQRKGTIPRCMRITNQGIEGVDISTISRHLFAGHTIKSWCFAEDPWSTIWVVRDDGELLSCTFIPEQELIAWAHHTITGGTVESVCAVPEGTEDTVYMLVRRTVVGADKLFLEKISSRTVLDIVDSKALDCSVTYDGRNTDPLLGLSVDAGAIGDTVDLRPENLRSGFFDELNAWLDDNVLVGAVIRVWRDDGTSVLVTDLSHGANHFHGVLQDTVTTAISATTQWAECLSNIGSSSRIYASAPPNASNVHSENIDNVGVLIDGAVYDLNGQTLEQVTLEIPAYYVVIGLKYTCDFESLDLPQARDNQKVVAAVGIEIANGRGGKVGKTLAAADLEEIQVREVSHSWDDPTLITETYRVPVRGEWSDHGRISYRQDEPVPVEIVGLTREVEVGG